MTKYKGKRIELHAAIAEEVLGRPLPPGAVVHHQDGDSYNNEKTNLVICPSQGYHRLLHARLNAFKATGNPSLRTCKICKAYDGLSNLIASDGNRTSFYHYSCKAAYDKERHANIKAGNRANPNSCISATARNSW